MKTEILNKSLCKVSGKDIKMPCFIKGMRLVRSVLGLLVALPDFHPLCTALVERHRFYSFTFYSARSLVRDGLD